MAEVRAVGSVGLSSNGNPSDNGYGNTGLRDHMNLSTPAGWTMVWWGLSVLIIVLMLMGM